MSEDIIEYKEIDGEEIAILTESGHKKIERIKFEFKLKEAEIPRDYWDIEFRDAGKKDNKESVEKCKNYFDEVKAGARKNLYLLSEKRGTGKTSTACAIGKKFVKAGYRVKFILAGELIDLLMKTQGFNYVKELEEEKRKYLNYNLVIVDDIFDKRKSLMWESASKSMIISAWDTFLRKLISHDVRLVLTSNILYSEIKRDFGEDIYELIDRNFQIIEFKDVGVKETRKKNLNID